MFKSFLTAVVIGSSSIPFNAYPTQALTVTEVNNKLDTIIVFMPSKDGNPIPVSYNLDGEKRDVYFAAFSDTAVSNLLKELKEREKKEQSSGFFGLFSKNKNKSPVKSAFENLVFSPASLTKFDNLIQPILNENSNARVRYIPDPTQRKMSKRLLASQGIKNKVINQIIDQVPIVFCPQPSILATVNEGSLAGETFVPCSTDYQTVKTLVDKSKKENKQIRKQNPKVLAITLPQFAKILSNSDGEDVKKLRVIPTPSSLKFINRSN